MFKFFYRFIQSTFVVLIVVATNLAQINFPEYNVDNNTYGTGGIFVSDLDGDDDLDALAASLADNQILWWHNDSGDPIVWTKLIITNNFTRPWTLYAAYLDGDEKTDAFEGSSHNGSNLVKWWKNDGKTGMVHALSFPEEFKLIQNYPNPFNPARKITYSISQRSFISLKDFDLLGNVVAILVNEEKINWTYEVDFNRYEFTSGIYFY